MYFKCCVRNCGSTRQDTILHKFPTNENRLNIWLKCLKDDSLYRSSHLKNLFVCHKHFEKRFVGATQLRLLNDARPTLFTLQEISTGSPSDTKMEYKPQVRNRHYDHIYCKQQLESSLENQDPLSDDIPFPEPEPEPELEPEPEPEPEPQYSWQRADTIILADEDTERVITCGNDTEELSMYDDDNDHNQPPQAASADEGRSFKADSTAEGTDPQEQLLHEGYSCNVCGQPIRGFRYACVQCADCDVCAACEAAGAHAEHYALRIPRPTPHDEIEKLLNCIRKHLFGDRIGDADAGTNCDLLNEIKSESEDAGNIQDENMSATAMLEQIEDTDDDQADPSYSPGGATRDGSSDEAQAQASEHGPRDVTHRRRVIRGRYAHKSVVDNSLLIQTPVHVPDDVTKRRDDSAAGDPLYVQTPVHGPRNVAQRRCIIRGHNSDKSAAEDQPVQTPIHGPDDVTKRRYVDYSAARDPLRIQTPVHGPRNVTRRRCVIRGHNSDKSAAEDLLRVQKPEHEPNDVTKGRYTDDSAAGDPLYVQTPVYGPHDVTKRPRIRGKYSNKSDDLMHIQTLEHGPDDSATGDLQRVLTPVRGPHDVPQRRYSYSVNKSAAGDPLPIETPDGPDDVTEDDVTQRQRTDDSAGEVLRVETVGGAKNVITVSGVDLRHGLSKQEIVALVEKEYGKKIVTIDNVYVKINRLTKEDVDAAINKTTPKS